MTVLLIVLFSFLTLALVIAIYLLFSPLVFLVDSGRSILWLGWNNRLNASFGSENGKWRLHLTLPFWRKKWKPEDLLRARHKNDMTRSKGSRKMSGSQTKEKRPIRWKKILASLKIREWEVLLDTDDFILNAYLYPVFTLFMAQGYNTRINFMGVNRVYVKGNISVMRLLKGLLLK
ncbi:MAG: hypothetical protein R3275_07140 [Saprospiraceae bacterium]|nr:hypothetical protein [Saprospiraceae bacterium]